ncbi:MAG: terpene cyclase/mutase family protein, partial [Chloroflexi bacterium]|nr:terpene cyclase/mutase family protein [Chloroflexota bacterium]
TADTVVALAAAGYDPDEALSDDGNSPLDYLMMQLDEGNVAGSGFVAKSITAVVAAGYDPADFGGYDLVGELLASEVDGVFGFGPYDHCLSLIALQNAGADVSEGAVDALVGIQNEDGGWGFMADSTSDTNTTALCLQALALTEEADTVDAGFVYIASIQNEDGGWPYENPSEYGTDSDTNSTALVILALVANGEALDEWGNPGEWLLSMQLESGSFSYQAAFPGDNVLATVGAVPAIEEVPLNAWALLDEAEAEAE